MLLQPELELNHKLAITMVAVEITHLGDKHLLLHSFIRTPGHLCRGRKKL